jgi:O-antigen/teichoic acid export membrane protein
VIRADIARRLIALNNSRNFRESASNAAYSTVEYLAQPFTMLLAAPYLVSRLGLQQYGIWMLVSAVLGSVGILSTGFGDATVKYVSAYRGRSDPVGVERTIRATLTINIALGSLLAFVVWLASPVAVHRIFRIESQFHTVSIQALRISALVLVIRSAESVFVSTLRAFERYGPAVKLNVVLRVAVTLSAVILAATGRGIVSIMWATLIWSALIVVLQAVAARGVAGPFYVLPTTQREALNEVFRFGCYSWLQALAAVVFGYADRFIVAAMLGTTPVAIYALSIQVTQPIHSLGAAMFNFVFPHVSARHEAGDHRGSRRVFRVALIANISLAFCLSLPFVVMPKLLLRVWMGAEVAEKGWAVLEILALSFAILAINVVPHYTLLALGRVRLIAALNIVSGVMLTAIMTVLILALGLPGAALGRLTYALLLVIPYLVVAWRITQSNSITPTVETVQA